MDSLPEIKGTFPCKQYRMKKAWYDLGNNDNLIVFQNTVNAHVYFDHSRIKSFDQE